MKRRIKLTESDLHKIVKESVNRVMYKKLKIKETMQPGSISHGTMRNEDVLPTKHITTMKISELTKLNEQAEKTYNAINDMMSNKSLELLDLAYPKHDGEQDSEAVAEMMMLRQTLSSLATASEILQEKLTAAIND